jgi:phosphate transport system substrate-binding protein
MNAKRLVEYAVVVAALVGVGAVGFAQPVKVDAKIPPYEKSKDAVSGKIRSVGSDTMNNLLALWTKEGFKKLYPNVEVEVEGKGSGTAPPALISGSAQFGPMSRPMKKTEIDQFESKFGYKPTQLPTALDALAVFVHKDNPIKSLTLEQVDAIFSKNRKGGGEKDIKTWGDLGLEGEWKQKPISLYGRNSVSGTYAFFKEHVLQGGDYKDSVKEQPGSAAVVEAVTNDKFAIGYSGIGYKTADVKAVPLAKTAKSKAIEATAEQVYADEYPLARYLYIYINHKPNTELDPLRREFIKYIFSKEGQEVVINDGYFPVTNAVRVKALKSVGLEDKQ